LIHIGGRSYELVEDHKNGWNPVAFRDRYSDVLDRYDYVIGDWGYNQLRLKGFFRDNHPKATPGSVISGIVDYINEYCNFGCAYFVLHKHPGGRREASEDDIDLDTLVVPVRTEGDEDNPELEAAPVAAGLAADGEERQPPREHIRAVPRHSQRRTPAPRKGSNGQREGEREEGQAASSNGSSNHRKSQGTAAVSGKEKSEHREVREKDRNKEGARQRNPQGGTNGHSNGAVQDKQERQQERKQGQGQQHEQQPKRKQDRQQGQQQDRKLDRQPEPVQSQERKQGQGKQQSSNTHPPIEKAPVAATVEDARPLRMQEDREQKEASVPVSSHDDRTQ